MKRFLIIPLLLCLLVSISSCTKVPNLEKIESVYISIKDIVYRDVIYKEVQVTIDNEQLFEIVRDFHESLEDYGGKKELILLRGRRKSNTSLRMEVKHHSVIVNPVMTRICSENFSICATEKKL